MVDSSSRRCFERLFLFFCKPGRNVGGSPEEPANNMEEEQVIYMCNSAYRVLLYYKFVKIEDPETFTQEHLQYCKDLGVKGRILIASEGINGTVSGTPEQTEQYMKDMHANPLFKDMVFKIDDVEEHAFKKSSYATKQSS